MTVIKIILQTHKPKLVTTLNPINNSSMEELSASISTFVRWKNFTLLCSLPQGTFRQILSDDGLNHFLQSSTGDLSIVVIRGNIFYEDQFNALLSEGSQINLVLKFLRKFNGDMIQAREAIQFQLIVNQLSREGFKPKRKCKMLLLQFNGDTEMVRREFANVVDEGRKRKRRERKMEGEFADEGRKRKRRERKMEGEKVKKHDRHKERPAKRRKIENNGEESKIEHERMFVKLGENFISYLGGDYPVESMIDFFSERFTKIYLDGNNMMFIENQIRALVLNRKKRTEGEQILANIASNFTHTINSRNEEFQTMLMFDASNLHGMIDQNMEIISAQKIGFGIADDALVSLMDNIFEIDEKAKHLFVTSDKELQQRLQLKGASIMTPGSFLKCVKNLIEEDLYKAILDQVVQTEFQ